MEALRIATTNLEESRGMVEEMIKKSSHHLGLAHQSETREREAYHMWKYEVYISRYEHFLQIAERDERILNNIEEDYENH